MGKKTSYILGILLTIILGTVLYYFWCCKPYCSEYNENKNNELVEPGMKGATRNPFAITDAKGDFNILENDNFNFKTSDFSILSPLSDKVTNGVLKLKEYLLGNPLKTIDITGFYKSDEINNSAYPNLGLARANAVKDYLVSQGIPSKQINTKGQLNDTIIPDESGTLFGPVEFGLTTRTADMDALKTACDAIRANPIVLYFKTGEASINLTAEQRQQIEDLSRCVDKMGVKVQVVGHTDSTGDADHNVVLGQQRADFAKNYLIKNGILSDNIEATSKGQTEPIADNATEQGKAKNRRTVVTID